MMKLAERIRAARLNQHLTVREVAAQAAVSPGYISKIEGRGEIPTADVLCRMSEILQVPAEELLELAKADQLERTERDISGKQAEALRLYRKKK